MLRYVLYSIITPTFCVANTTSFTKILIASYYEYRKIIIILHIINNNNNNTYYRTLLITNKADLYCGIWCNFSQGGISFVQNGCQNGSCTK